MTIYTQFGSEVTFTAVKRENGVDVVQCDYHDARRRQPNGGQWRPVSLFKADDGVKEIDAAIYALLAR